LSSSSSFSSSSASSSSFTSCFLPPPSQWPTRPCPLFPSRVSIPIIFARPIQPRLPQPSPTPSIDHPAEALIDDINTDVAVALNSLARPAYAACAADPFLTGPPGGHQPA
jgi:hypothetical protein